MRISPLVFVCALFASHCAPPPSAPDAGDSGDARTVSACEARVRAYANGGAARGECPVFQCADSREMQLTVGTGRDATLDGFAPLRDGDPLYVVPGEQGLQHFRVGFRGMGFDATLPLIEVRARRAEDCEEIGFLRFRLPFRSDPADPSRLAVEGVRVVITDDLDRYEYCSILGRDVILVVDATTPLGQWAHHEVRVHVPDIDPTTRPDLREAWRNACARRDGGTLADAAPLDVVTTDP